MRTRDRDFKRLGITGALILGMLFISAPPAVAQDVPPPVAR